MIKQLTTRRNLNLAYTQVYRNKGGCGVDGIRVDELKSIFQTHGNMYVERVKVGKHQPSPILGIESQIKLTNRRIRDPYVRWCERRTGSHSTVSRLLD